MNTGLSAATTVGDAARAVPSAARVFDRFGIDYCCGGRLTIAQACGRARADPDAVLAALNAPEAPAAAETDWSLAGITGLCDHIQSTHHAFVRDAFDRLAGLMPRVINAHAARHPWLTLLESALAQLRAELLDHMFREERVLFPWLRRLDKPGAATHGPPWSIKRPIDCMVHDHDGVGLALEHIRTLTHDHAIPANACPAMTSLMRTLVDLDRDTRIHIHKENNILFPAGILAEATSCPARGVPADKDMDIRVH